MKNEDFLAQMILKANPSIDEAWLEMLVWDCKPVLEDWVFTHIMERLSPEDRKELISLTNDKNYISGKAYTFLCQAIPNYETFIWSVYDKFEEIYIRDFKHFYKY